MSSIIVTGASSGIGAAVALALAGPQNHLILAARSNEKLERIARQVEARGGRATPHSIDLAKIDGIEELAALLEENPVLINSAGAAAYAPFAELPWEDFQTQVQVNFVAPARLIHAALPIMLQRGGGQIINVLSMAATHVLPSANAYSASKAALLMLAKTVSQEYRAQGIRVTNLLPGATATPIWDGSPMESRKSEMIPTEEVASLIALIVANPDTFNLDEVLMMPPKGVL